MSSLFIIRGIEEPNETDSPIEGEGNVLTVVAQDARGKCFEVTAHRDFLIGVNGLSRLRPFYCTWQRSQENQLPTFIRQTGERLKLNFQNNIDAKKSNALKMAEDLPGNATLAYGKIWFWDDIIDDPEQRAAVFCVEGPIEIYIHNNKVQIKKEGYSMLINAEQLMKMDLIFADNESLDPLRRVTKYVSNAVGEDKDFNVFEQIPEEKRKFEILKHEKVERKDGKDDSALLFQHWLQPIVTEGRLFYGQVMYVEGNEIRSVKGFFKLRTEKRPHSGYSTEDLYVEMDGQEAVKINRNRLLGCNLSFKSDEGIIRKKNFLKAKFGTKAKIVGRL